jgi:hypothetical protein
MSNRPRNSTSQATGRGRNVAPRRSLRIPVLVGIAIVLLLAVGVLAFTGRGSSGPVAETSPGQPVPTMPTRDHVEEGTPVEYTTNPPTSGPHWATTARWGVHSRRPPPDQRLVHNLEHGGVIIFYDPAQVDEATVEDLTELTNELQQERVCILLTPRDSIQDDKPIALAAWGVLALLDEYDDAAIRAFWRDHAAQGPEFGAGQCG